MSNNPRLPLLAGVLGAAAVLAYAQLSLAVGEQVGRIRGVVTNPSTGQALEGVSISAGGPALIGPPRSTFSGADGRYELIDLPPGVYQVSFSYPGTVPSNRQVTVRLGEAVTVNLAYSLVSEGVETVSINVGRQLTKPDSAQTGRVHDLETLDRLPTTRDYQGVALTTPGVTDTGVSGGNPYIKGAHYSLSKFLIDGLDVTDPVTGTFANNLTFDSTESVDVITGAMDAEYNALGGVINVITRGGGDDFRSVASVYANHQKLSAKGNFGPNIYEGRQPFDSTKAGPTESYQASLDVGGPIIKRRLWYGLTYEFDYTKFSPIKAEPLGVAPYDIQHPPRTFNGHIIRLKLGGAPTANQRVWLSANADPATIENREGGNDRLGVAEQRQRQGGFFGIAGWEWRVSENLIPSVQVGFLQSFLDIGPMGWYGDYDKTGCEKFTRDYGDGKNRNCDYSREQPRHTNSADNTFWYQGTSKQYDKRNRIQVDPNVRIRGRLAGEHNVKVGLQGQWLRHSWDYRIPGGQIYIDDPPGGELLEEGLCDPANPGPNCFLRIDVQPFKTVVKGYGLGVYAQDRWWTPLTWLTLNPGIRFDWGRTIDHRGNEATNLHGFAPRFGFTADVTRDGRNILFGYAGRNTQALSLDAVADFAPQEAYADETFRWNQAANMGAGAWQSIAASGGEGGAVIAKNAKIPRSDELTAGFRREIWPDTLASVEYTWKRIAYTWDTHEINRIWDPTGSRTIGWADETKIGREVFESSTPEDPTVYHGLVLATEGRPSPNWDYGANYTLSWTTFRETLNNPRFAQFARGFTESDIRHNIRLFGSYAIRDRVVLGAYFQYQTGTPLTKGFYNIEQGEFTNQRSPSGTTPGAGTQINDPSAISYFRVPDYMRMDVRMMVNLLPSRMRQQLHLVVDVFNVFNLRNTTDVVADDIARFGQVAGRQSPFRAQFGLRYAWGAPVTRYAEEARNEDSGVSSGGFAPER